MNKRSALKASSWLCSGLLPGVSPVFDHTQTILGELVSPLAWLPERSLGALPPREHALEFGTITASSWRCSGLLPGVSPVFDRTQTILGEIVSPLARPPELSLGALPPREHALEFGTITASSWRCSGLLPRVSPVFDHTETILGEIVSPLARLPGLSLGALSPREHALEFGTIAASSWRCSGLLPRVSPVFDHTETILGEIVFPLARLPGLSLGALPPREHALEFGTIAASSWRCSGLLQGVSPVFDRTQTILGELVSPLAWLPERSLGALPPREHALEFGTIRASSWRCSGLLPGVSPVFDRAQTILGEIGSPLGFPSELSLGALAPREHAFAFGTITASSWRCSGLLPRVSPVFDHTETILGEIVSPLARLPGLSLGALPLESTLSSSVPSRHLLGAVAVYYWGSPQYSIVHKLFWGNSFPHSPGSQSGLLERFPLESTLSSSVPSRHLLGVVAVYYQGSPQNSIVQKLLFWGKSFPRSPGPQSCLWGRFPRASTLSSSVSSRHLLGAVAVYYRGSPQYSIIQKLFWGKSYPHSPGSQVCLWERFPLESTLSSSVPSRHLLGAVAVYYWGSPQ